MLGDHRDGSLRTMEVDEMRLAQIETDPSGWIIMKGDPEIEGQHSPHLNGRYSHHGGRERCLELGEEDL